MRTHLVIASLLLSAVIGACGSSSKKTDEAPVVRDDRPVRRETGGGLWEQLRESRAQKEKRMEAQGKALERSATERAQVPPELAAKLDAWWHQFVNLDPSWLDARAHWRKEGPQARNLLVENLIMLAVRSYEIGNGILYKRACTELVEWPDEATPYLVQGLTTDNTDDVVRGHCAHILGMIAGPALPAIQAAYDGEDPKGRLDLVRAVRGMAVPEVTPFLIKVVENERDFRLRITAIEGLGKTRDRRALPVLIACLRDADVSVRKFAGGYLGGFEDHTAVQPLIDCMKQAEARRLADANEGEVAENCSRSLAFITKQRFSRASEWQAWWQRNKSS